MTEPEKSTSSSSTSQTTNIPDFELIVGELDGVTGGSVSYVGEGEGGLQAAADCLRLMGEGVRDEADISEIVERLRKSTDKGEFGGLTSTATTVSSSMASQWITHMKRTFKRHALALSEEQQGILKKIVHEEVWEFADIYTRLFQGKPPRHVSSLRRRLNELRPRHDDMNLRFAETATLMTFALAKQSSREPVHYSAASLHGFLLLKMKKYTEAIEVVDFVLSLYDKAETRIDDLAILITYKAEALIGIGRFNRAIKYCNRVIKGATSVRARHRATMLIAIAYMRKNNFKRAHEHVIVLLSEGRLDEQMIENVALLGLNLAHLMGNMELFNKFENMLQQIVY
uniref:TPR_REGION domain-containing protein n=1 Tax=Caenorhabditis tropicalis TaxID=1561998 RepID=A0A1I7T254_9PELO